VRTLTELGDLAETAVREYLTKGQPLTEALVKIASNHKLSPAEVTSLSNEANKRTIVALHSQVPRGNLSHGFSFPLAKDEVILSLLKEHDGAELRARPTLPPTDTRAKVLLELGAGDAPLDVDDSPSEDDIADNPSLATRSNREVISRVIEALMCKIKEREARLVMARLRLEKIQRELVGEMSDQAAMGVPVRVLKTAAPELAEDIDYNLSQRGTFKAASLGGIEYEVDRDHPIFDKINRMRSLDAVCQAEDHVAESLRTKVAALRRAYKEVGL